VAGGRRSWGRLADRFYDALVAGDERTATTVVQRLHAEGEAVVAVLGWVVVPGLRRVGEGWADGTLTVADEHRASEIVERLLASLDRRGPGRPRGTAVVAAPPGEQHGLPVAMAAAALRADGWSVEHLGRDLPVEDLRGFVERHRPHLVVLTATTPPAQAAAAEVRDRLAGDGHAVLLGGPGGSLEELVQLARETRAAERRGEHDGPASGA